MEPPQTPIDIKVTLGSPEGIQNLINVEANFTDTKEQVLQVLGEKKITKDYGHDCVLLFDFYTEQGRQKQAVDFFNQEQGTSPLQIVFKMRPGQNSQTGKFQIQQHTGFIRLVYHFFTPVQEEDIVKLNSVLSIFQANGLKLQSHLSVDLKGIVSHNKKNRTNVKVDYAQVHFLSNAFSSQSLFNSLMAIDDLQSQFQQMSQYPFFDLLKKSKVAKVNLKFDSFRRLNKYYNQVAQPEKQAESKQFKYVNKGIFRQRADATFIYNSQYMININGKFESEDVFIRLVKVYAKFFEKLLGETLYYDD